MCEDRLNIFLAIWMESVTTIIFEISYERTAWLIPYLMAKNSALEEVTLIAQ